MWRIRERSMSSNELVKMVQEIYAAFGQGRISDILDQLGDEMVFIQPGGPEIPWSGTSRSRNEVAQFFAKLDAAVAVERFEPRDYVSSADTVVALGFWSGKSKATGRPFSSDWAMVWKFRNGKAYYFQSFLDTSTLAKQFR
jgi:ketosteroid isomerase-like protein